MEAKDKELGILENLDYVIAGIALSVLVLVTFVGVFTPYFLKMPFAWGEEFQLACFVWITFLGVGAAFRSGSHVAIELLVERMPERVARYVELGGYAVSMIIFTFFLYYGTQIVLSMVAMGRTTNILGIPYAAIYIVVPIGCLLMMYNYTRIILKKGKEAH